MSAPPLVSFILFAYNQERFIGEAVDAVLAQTYEPLEIILSDDGSSDRTFEIMQERVAAYRGPHQISAIRNPQNLGVVEHVFTRGKSAQGEIIVVAAGDDVSMPERTTMLVEAFGDDETVLAVTSGCEIIDEAGSLISISYGRPSGQAASTGGAAYFQNLGFEFNTIQGSVAAYRRKAFHFPTPLGDTGLWEDNLLNFLIYANGGQVKARTEPLVRYRQHGSALVNRKPEVLSRAERERRMLARAEKYIRRMETFLWISENCARPELVDVAAIQGELRRHRLIASWPQMSLAQRGAALIDALLNFQRSLARWQAARLIGRFPNYVPASWVRARKGS